MAKRFIDGQEVTSSAFLEAVGTVSESGGVPTGAIIESGSDYTKFADGTLICVTSYSSAISGGQSNYYATGMYRYILSVSLPVSYVGTIRGFGARAQDGSRNGMVTEARNGTFSYASATGPASSITAIEIVWIGRWY